MFIKKWQRIILYTDWMDWGTGHLTIIEGKGGETFVDKNWPQGRAFEQFFSNARGMPGQSWVCDMS